MRRTLRSVLSIISCALIVTMGVSAEENDKANALPPDMKRIIDRGKIVVALHKEDGAPFYSVTKDGKLCGLDIDIANDIGRTLGLEVEFNREPTTFDAVVQMVADGRADMAISCVSRTRKRAVKVSFSTPYVRLYHAFVINRIRSAGISTGRAFSEWMNSPQVSIGTLRGSSYVEFMQRDYPKARVVLFDSWSDASRAVIEGEILTAVFDDSMVRGWVNGHPEDVLYVQTKIVKDKEDPLSIVVNWQDTHLLRWINIHLDTISRNGTLNKLKTKWLEKDAIKRK